MDIFSAASNAITNLMDKPVSGNTGINGGLISKSTDSVLTNIGNALISIFGPKQPASTPDVIITANGPQTGSGTGSLSLTASKSIWLILGAVVVLLLFGKVILRTIKRLIR